MITLTKVAEVAVAEAGETVTETVPAPAGLLAQLRPYLPTRHIAVVLCSGSVALSARMWTWATADGKWRVGRGRLGGIAAALYVAGYYEHHGQSWVLPLVCGAWVVGALLHSPGKSIPAGKAVDVGQEADVDAEFEGEPAESAPLPRLDPDVVVRLAYELAGAVDAANRNAVQLDHLVGHLPGASKEAVIGALAEVGTPIKEQVKYRLPGGRQQVRQGVRLEDLPAWPGEAPVTPAPGLHAVPAPAAPGTPAQAPAAGPADPSPAPAPGPLQEAG